MTDAIAHPTDFSPESEAAFFHALALARAHRCRLDLLHVRQPHSRDEWNSFPHVREVLVRWGLLEPGASTAAIARATGVTVRKSEISDTDPLDGLSRFLWSHRPDLVVMATHSRTGLERLLKGSVTESMARQTHLPVLAFPPGARPFVDSATGALRLGRVLIAVAHRPSPARAILRLDDLLAPFDVTRDLVHAGAEPPPLTDTAGAPLTVRTVVGDAAAVVIGERARTDADIIAVVTSGRHGLLDAFLGSTSEQILRQAPCPILTLPA